jgi:hypothetical protein
VASLAVSLNHNRQSKEEIDMAAAFKAMIMTLGLLVGALMIMEGVAWWLHSTATEKNFPVTPLRGQFSILMDTPQPIAHFRSELT